MTNTVAESKAGNVLIRYFIDNISTPQSIRNLDPHGITGFSLFDNDVVYLHGVHNHSKVRGMAFDVDLVACLKGCC